MIYELSLYIGKAGAHYTILFTNMEAAQRKAAEFRRYFNNVQMFGTIKALTAKGDTYEPDEGLTQFINS